MRSSSIPQRSYKQETTLTVDEIKRAVTKVSKQYSIKNAYLFGSYANGCANDESDVDISTAVNGLAIKLFTTSF